MGQKRWHSGSTVNGAAAFFAALAIFGATRVAAAAEVAVIPSSSGHLGAWLALGPLLVAPQAPKKASPSQPDAGDEPNSDATAGLSASGPSPTGSNGSASSNAAVDLDTSVVPNGSEDRLTGARGRTIAVTANPRSSSPTESATWRLVTSRDGALDLATGLAVKGTGEAFALLSGIVRVRTPFDGALLIGASDGIRVYVDRKQIFTNDDRRPEHDDDYVLPLHFGAGDHAVLIKLRRRAGDPYAWAARVRLVDATLRAPIGAALVLPGTDDHDARTLASSLVSVDVNRGLGAGGFRPVVTARFSEGAPRDADRRVVVSASLVASASDSANATGKPLFRVDAGQIPVDDGGAGEMSVTLPFISANEIAKSAPGGLGTDASKLTITVETAGRTVPAVVTWRPSFVDAMAVARDAIALCEDQASFLDDPKTTRATLANLRDRLASYVGRGDTDVDTLEAEAQTLIAYLADLRAGHDPLRFHAGIRRFAYPSPLDGQPSQFGVYVPSSYKPGNATKYPLIVALHGMNGRPIAILRAFFGHDDGRDGEWQDRHLGNVDSIEAFVVSPNGHGNGMYRDLGEVDVMAVLDWAERFFPIDLSRVTITGPSMGGTGAASIPLHYPDRFAAAEPLCGYHSYMIRGDLKGLPMRPWETLLSEQRSNALWADNGLDLPLYIWHGTRDWPVKNSGVLIDRYNELGYSIEHEHPNVGHDVWKKAYADLGGFHWLEKHKIPEAPTHVVFKTDTLRYSGSHWLKIDELEGQLELGSVDARIASRSEGGKTQDTVSTAREPKTVEIKTKNVLGLTLDRAAPFNATDAIEARIDGDKLSFASGSPVAMHRVSGHWVSGKSAPPPTLSKRAGLSGPIRDAFFEPLLFVYGTLDPNETAVNEEVARYFARVRGGVDIHYPVIADSDLDDARGASHSLFLIGSSRSNRVVARLDPKLPFHVSADHVDGGGRTFRGEELGVAFVVPNPEHTDRYVVVVEGATALGTFRATFLPDLLPDWIVYDKRVAPMRGQIVLGFGKPVAAGLFDRSWGLTIPPE